MVAADGASLLAAAVRAVILAKAPRRTVQAVAAAVTSALVHQPAASRTRAETREPAGTPAAQPAVPKSSSPEELVAALQASRQDKRRRKKERRRANRSLRTSNGQAAGLALTEASLQRHDAEHAGDADNYPGGGGDMVAIPRGSPGRSPPRKLQRQDGAVGGSARALPPVPPFPQASAEKSETDGSRIRSGTVWTQSDNMSTREADLPAGDEAMGTGTAVPSPTADSGAGGAGSGGKPRPRRKRQ